MNFLKNLKIKSKLLLLVIFPLLGLIYFAGTQTYDAFNNVNNMKKIDTVVVLSTKISLLVHEIQKERGMTAGFIGSKGKKFDKELPAQVKLSNKKFKELTSFIKTIDFDDYTLEFKNLINKATSLFKESNKIRISVLAKSISSQSAIAYYTSVNTLFLDTIVNIAKLTNDIELSHRLTAYSSFLLSKERAGIERAIGANTLSRDAFEDGMKTKLNQLISAQNSYLKTFEYYASEKSKKLYKKTLKGKAVDEVEKIRNTLLQSEKKHKIISEIKKYIGYGGLIHNFKNYLIRGNDKYSKNVITQYKEVIILIKEYKSLPNITNRELKLLDDVKFAFTKYYNGIPKIIEAIKTNQGTKELDKIVKVSDSPAIKAIDKLSTRIFSVDPQYWFSQMTKKINLLKNVDDHLSTDLLGTVKSKTATAQTKFVMYNIFIFIIFLFVFLVIKYITLNILNSLNTFKEGLEYFFKYAVREKEYIKPLKVDGKDEFAEMTLNMNTQVLKTEKLIEQDKKVVVEINDVMEKVANGFFGYTIKEEAATNEVETLRTSINKMLSDTKVKFDSINSVLSNYAVNKYNFKLNEKEKNGIYGDLGTIFTSTSLLGNSLSGLMAMISAAGNELTHDTDILKSSSKKLSTASNEQAASLEETAAAVEEITANIQSNSANVLKMASLSDTLNKSAKVGNNLASKTSTSMDEINNKVSTINDAIEVIDQIAFQTNILSLNAAVEAATAGEAGKGFAVVAQEVRNLASRSAEAAKEIKELVEEAALKSNEGKSIANEMIEGYKNLSEVILETKDIIDDVSVASKEQTEGMLQINDAVNALDHMTQENASTASQIDSLSSTISTLSSKLSDITSVAQFDEEAKQQALDIKFTQSVAKYKNDHINFKVNNFSKIDTFAQWTVVDCNSCNMGKWIIECEKENKKFVNTPEWNKLKKVHTQVHKCVQSYVDKNAQKASNEELRIIAATIEKGTIGVFDQMDAVLGANGRL